MGNNHMNMKCEHNPNWKGDKAKRMAIHVYLRHHTVKPKLCEECNKEEPFDLANISGKYLRDINDYRWLCRKCHMIIDGRINNLKNQWYGD